jgi:hypothetical protein
MFPPVFHAVVCKFQTDICVFFRPIPVVAPKAALKVVSTAAMEEETTVVDEQKQKDRAFARESEKRFIRIQSVCRYIFGAFIGLMLAHILAVFIDIGLKIASAFSSANEGLGNASGTCFGTIVSVVCFIYNTVKNNMVAAWRLFQNLCTLIVVGFIVYTYYIKSMYGDGTTFLMPY